MLVTGVHETGKSFDSGGPATITAPTQRPASAEGLETLMPSYTYHLTVIADQPIDPETVADDIIGQLGGLTADHPETGELVEVELYISA
ncbi:hypothetical protein [Streptomyces sp. NPDC018693]|uniref:hypothetical protein n=1 Tax=unclassified Streptomyces TaxID=2593676 RepID=UPI0037A15F2F